MAIGGRSTLLGPVLRAIAVAWAQTSLSEQFPSGWTYAQGLLFIVVVGFFPAGLAGIVAALGRGDSRRNRCKRLPKRPNPHGLEPRNDQGHHGEHHRPSPPDGRRT